MYKRQSNTYSNPFFGKCNPYSTLGGSTFGCLAQFTTLQSQTSKLLNTFHPFSLPLPSLLLPHPSSLRPPSSLPPSFTLPSSILQSLPSSLPSSLPPSSLPTSFPPFLPPSHPPSLLPSFLSSLLSSFLSPPSFSLCSFLPSSFPHYTSSSLFSYALACPGG